MMINTDTGRGMIAAGLVAGTWPGLLFFLVSMASPNGLPFAAVLTTTTVMLGAGLAIAFAHVVLIALPAYLLLERRLHPAWWHAAIAGWTIGALPVTGWLALLYEPEFVQYPSEFLPIILAFGISGLIGGVAFWIVATGAMRPRIVTGVIG